MACGYDDDLTPTERQLGRRIIGYDEEKTEREVSSCSSIDRPSLSLESSLWLSSALLARQLTSVVRFNSLAVSLVFCLCV